MQSARILSHVHGRQAMGARLRARARLDLRPELLRALADRKPAAHS